jgi:hypothetical protein
LTSLHWRRFIHFEKSCPTFWFREREESCGIVLVCGWLVCVCVVS